MYCLFYCAGSERNFQSYCAGSQMHFLSYCAGSEMYCQVDYAGSETHCQFYCAGTAIIGWDEPEDPNGMIISYNIQYLALDFPEQPYSDRRRAINEDLLKCFIHLGRTNETFLLRSSEIKQISLNNLCERLKNN